MIIVLPFHHIFNVKKSYFCVLSGLVRNETPRNITADSSEYFSKWKRTHVRDSLFSFLVSDQNVIRLTTRYQASSELCYLLAKDDSTYIICSVLKFLFFVLECMTSFQTEYIIFDINHILAPRGIYFAME